MSNPAILLTSTSTIPTVSIILEIYSSFAYHILVVFLNNALVILPNVDSFVSFFASKLHITNGGFPLHNLDQKYSMRLVYRFG